MSKPAKQRHLPNRLSRALSSVCEEFPLAEKWLIAPSHRVGDQWIETVVASGRPVVNVRVWTLKALALHLAGPLLAKKALENLPPSVGPIVADLVWSRSAKRRAGSYLSGLEPGWGFAQTLYRTINDLRLAGVEPDGIDTDRFEVEAKGADIKTVLAQWNLFLGELSFADDAQVLSLARSRLTADPGCLPAGLRLLHPADAFESALEKDLIDAIPQSSRQTLPVDETQTATDEGAEVFLFRASGEINEVRHVFRRCLEESIPLDQVELVHTDSGTYLRLIYETLACTSEKAATFEMEMPATFAEGLPARFMRPGRALAAWVSWNRRGFLQRTVGEMIHEGLLKVGSSVGSETRFSHLAGLFGAVGIGMGRDRYIKQIGDSIAASRKRSGREAGGAESDGGTIAERLEKNRDDVACLELLESLVKKLLRAAPDPDAAPDAILEGALSFLKHCARSVNRFDHNAFDELTRKIRETLAFITDGGVGAFDAWDWLERLPDEVRVEGSGPRPGRIHVSNIGAGGHSGRPHTFIIGLDDGRFPGVGAQDPLLLDGERRHLSSELATAEKRLKKKTSDFDRLRARLRGTVSLGFSCRDLVGDRDLFAGPALLDAFRDLCGKSSGDHRDLDRWLDAPAAFVPATNAQAIDSGEWWLWRLCGTGRVRGARDLVGERYPFLAQGFRAAAARRGDSFTAWDGAVPIAGTDHDPFSEGGPVLSASALERIGTCPRAYFFQYVLGIKRPDELEIDAALWLDPLAFGSLLHEVLHCFMCERIAAKELPPSFERDWSRLRAIVAEKAASYREIHPVYSESVFQAQARELEKSARIFLRDEESHCQTRRPLFLEASIGMSSVGDGSGIDRAEPLRLPLLEGRAIRVRGRIDRIDEIVGAGGAAFELWDYKSGGSGKYTDAAVFGNGRVVQHALYMALSGARLREEVAADAAIERFGYFFPGVRGRGERLTWTGEELSQWRYVVDALCRVAHEGAFLRTVEPDRCRYCDFLSLCGEEPAAACKKLASRSNSALAPLLELQNYD